MIIGPLSAVDEEEKALRLDFTAVNSSLRHDREGGLLFVNGHPRSTDRTWAEVEVENLTERGRPTVGLPKTRDLVVPRKVGPEPPTP